MISHIRTGWLSAVFSLIIFLAITICSAVAQTPESYEQARVFSVRQDKPILLEFVHED